MSQYGGGTIVLQFRWRVIVKFNSCSWILHQSHFSFTVFAFALFCWKAFRCYDVSFYTSEKTNCLKYDCTKFHFHSLSCTNTSPQRSCILFIANNFISLNNWLEYKVDADVSFYEQRSCTDWRTKPVVWITNEHHALIRFASFCVLTLPTHLPSHMRLRRDSVQFAYA